MAKIVSIIVAVVFIQLSAYPQSRLPNVRVETIKGESVDISNVVEDNKGVVYIFWGSICSSCNTSLNNLSDHFEEWNKEIDFQVIAVCTDDQRGVSKAKSKALINDWPFTVIFDKNQDFKRAMGVNAVPYFIVTDKKGKITYSRAGYIPGIEDEIYDILKANNNLK